MADELAAYRRCMLCEHRCAVDRMAGERGLCRAGVVPRVFQYGVEYGEERQLLPCNVIYLSGCDLRCRFCISAADSFAPSHGEELTRKLLERIVAEGIREGARTIQFSGGEPSIYAPTLCELLRGLALPVPLVWKSNLHETIEALEMIRPWTQVCLADLKFGSDRCAERLSGARDYVALARRNLRWMNANARVIVRHLLLPGHEGCCLQPILRWMADELPGVELSLRDSFMPTRRRGELARAITRHEAANAAVLAGRLHLRVVS